MNTGAFDPFTDIIEHVRGSDAPAWIHVDGAFGLWARAAPARAHLVDGIELADSWATDAHKWLNSPYDCGIAIVRDGDALRKSMAINADYLPGDHTNPSDYTPEVSRRPRGVDAWAALRALGRSGLADLVERHCRLARRFAQAFTDAGFAVLNDVVLNQVLVSFGDAERTRRVIAAIQDEGTCWCGATVWQGTDRDARERDLVGHDRRGRRSLHRGDPAHRAALGHNDPSNLKRRGDPGRPGRM